MLHFITISDEETNIRNRNSEEFSKNWNELKMDLSKIVNDTDDALKKLEAVNEASQTMV